MILDPDNSQTDLLGAFPFANSKIPLPNGCNSSALRGLREVNVDIQAQKQLYMVYA